MESQLSSLFFPFVAFLLFILMVQKIFKKSDGKVLPGPWRLPIIGNVHNLIGSLPHRRLTTLAKKYGPLMSLQLGEVPTVVVSSAELAKAFLKTHETVFANRPFNLAATCIAYNCNDIIFTPYGDYWRELRKISILELLTAKRVRSFRSFREEEVSEFVKYIHSTAGEPFNLTTMLISVTTCMNVRSAFGKSLKQKDAFVPLIVKILKSMGGFTLGDVFPSSKLLRLMSGSWKFEKMHKEIDAVLENIINEHRAKKMETKSEENQQLDSKGEDAYEDLVDVLLNLQDQRNTEFTFTIRTIKAIILDVFLGGSETAALVIEWAMSELLKNPSAMEKAQKELRQVFHNKETIEESSLKELKYFHFVIKEALRLHPPPLIPRECRETFEINGYVIPANTQVLVNAWAIGRDPRNWEEPERFYPERFLDSSIDFKGTNFEFLPFGAGRRICPGMLYGMATVELPLANLLYHFDWKLPDGLKPEDLDMSEALGLAAGKKHNLHLIAIPFLSNK